MIHDILFSNRFRPVVWAPYSAVFLYSLFAEKQKAAVFGVKTPCLTLCTLM